jgi:hypothetical protein
LVWSDSENWWAAVRSQRLLCLVLPAREGLDDFAPLAEDVEQRADQPGDGQPVVVLLPLGPEEPDRDRREDERDAKPAEESENALHHD